jgi:hypothetical protein
MVGRVVLTHCVLTFFCIYISGVNMLKQQPICFSEPIILFTSLRFCSSLYTVMWRAWRLNVHQDRSFTHMHLDTGMTNKYDEFC